MSTCKTFEKEKLLPHVGGVKLKKEEQQNNYASTSTRAV